MMGRILAAGLILAALPLWHYWRFDDLGMVTIEAGGMAMRGNLLGVVVVFGIGFLILQILGGLLGLPGRIHQYMRERTVEKGMAAFYDLTYAQALDIPDQARSAAKKLMRFWPHNAISLYHSAQIAQAQGQDQIYQHTLAKLAQGTQEAPLHDILCAQELLKNDQLAEAAVLLEKMSTQAPTSRWIAQNLFSCAYRLGNFDHALRVVEAMRRARLFSPQERGCWQSQALTLQAAQMPPLQALESYTRAVSLDPHHTTAALAGARVAHQLGKTSKARALVAQAWAARPPLDVAQNLAEVYLDTFAVQTAAERLDHFDRLKSLTPDYPDQFRVEAVLALKAQLWTRARNAMAHCAVHRRVEDYVIFAAAEMGDGQVGQAISYLKTFLDFGTSPDRAPETPSGALMVYDGYAEHTHG